MCDHILDMTPKYSSQRFKRSALYSISVFGRIIYTTKWGIFFPVKFTSGPCVISSWMVYRSNVQIPSRVFLG